MTASAKCSILATAMLASTVRLSSPAVGGESGWQFSLTTYSWLPWISGDLGIANRNLDVDVNPGDVLEALDWSSLPLWMSYAELKSGRLTLFNDTMWTALHGPRGSTHQAVQPGQQLAEGEC